MPASEERSAALLEKGLSQASSRLTQTPVVTKEALDLHKVCKRYFSEFKIVQTGEISPSLGRYLEPTIINHMRRILRVMGQLYISEVLSSELPVRTPERWHGSRVEHDGASIFCRIWRNVEDYVDAGMSESLKIGNYFSRGSRSICAADENHVYVLEETVVNRPVSENSDVGCAEVSMRLLKRSHSDEN